MSKKKQKTSVEKFWGIWNVTESILLMIAGVLAITVGAISVANPDNANMQDVAKTIGDIVPFVAGLFIVMDAIMRVIISFTKFRKDSDESAMMVGSFEATVGIVIMMFYTHFTELVADFVAVFMMCIGVSLIIFSIISIAKGKSKIFIPILEILFAAMLIAVGVAILVIYYQDSGNVARQRLVLIISGSILFISGIAYLIMTRISRRKQEKEKLEEETPKPKGIKGGKGKPSEIEHNPDVIDNDDIPEIPIIDDDGNEEE